MLNVVPETYGSFLVPLLTQKLPSDLKMIMSRKFKNDIWDLKEMLVIFKEELEAKERCTFANTLHTDSDGDPYSTANLHNQNRNRKQYRQMECVYCRSSEHFSSQCLNVTDVKSRVAALRKAARCFVCLKKSHISKSCTASYQCKNCGRRHHISICDFDSSRKNDQLPERKKVTFDTSNHTVNTCSSNAGKSVLLETARANVFNVETNLGYYVRILFDGGSQRTYITSELREI